MRATPMTAPTPSVASTRPSVRRSSCASVVRPSRATAPTTLRRGTRKAPTAAGSGQVSGSMADPSQRGQDRQPDAFPLAQRCATGPPPGPQRDDDRGEGHRVEREHRGRPGRQDHDTGQGRSIARATLTVTLPSDAAAGICSRGTSSGWIACHAGAVSAEPQPMATVNPQQPGRVRTPVNASVASAAAASTA